MWFPSQRKIVFDSKCIFHVWQHRHPNIIHTHSAFVCLFLSSPLFPFLPTPLLWGLSISMLFLCCMCWTVFDPTNFIESIYKLMDGCTVVVYSLTIDWMNKKKPYNNSSIKNMLKTKNTDTPKSPVQCEDTSSSIGRFTMNRAQNSNIQSVEILSKTSSHTLSGSKWRKLCNQHGHIPGYKALHTQQS